MLKLREAGNKKPLRICEGYKGQGSRMLVDKDCV